jgi:hypothetical protein
VPDSAGGFPQGPDLPHAGRAVPDTRLAEINQAAATTGNDPELDTLLLRLSDHTHCSAAFQRIRVS